MSDVKSYVENTGTEIESVGALQQARALTLPSRDEMLKRAPSVQRFWDTNRSLLEKAWKEWDVQNEPLAEWVTESLISEPLRNAVTLAWEDPAKEQAVADLWEEVVPGVYQAQLFDVDKLQLLRNYLDGVADAGIPVRPPYGIALNRNGGMLDARSEGYLAAPTFQDFYNVIMDKYMRPISRLLFPEVMGFDSQTFGFSIQYQEGMDTSLRPHTDASAATMNVNLNVPGETFKGSEVDFFNQNTGKVTRTVFEPGVAMLHRGSVPHAVQPITGGSRTNMVLWLYGNSMQIPRGALPTSKAVAKSRWTVPNTPKDSFAPF
ncbi:2OG-Fe(II) oxygenase [Alteromonas sp. BL110]|uniref:2OG-Fe(II) oxygenase family protein n=1 Tax=Alteromonas sp. BL110 TaxID=1714845 RepID=UPI000E4AB17A|nr:2OG-Fe(II) oxygenase family protein [Alteromonas sp. BL110]AXT37444.1 2OG-Fe(II) oxygenase [Alteromonas sp. BL110]RKM80181.1 2OG-Fe(II) oxygenase [Alteromonas sp. BL110]